MNEDFLKRLAVNSTDGELEKNVEVMETDGVCSVDDKMVDEYAETEDKAEDTVERSNGRKWLSDRSGYDGIERVQYLMYGKTVFKPLMKSDFRMDIISDEINISNEEISSVVTDNETNTIVLTVCENSVRKCQLVSDTRESFAIAKYLLDDFGYIRRCIFYEGCTVESVTESRLDRSDKKPQTLEIVVKYGFAKVLSPEMIGYSFLSKEEWMNLFGDSSLLKRESLNVIRPGKNRFYVRFSPNVSGLQGWWIESVMPNIPCKTIELTVRDMSDGKVIVPEIFEKMDSGFNTILDVLDSTGAVIYSVVFKGCCVSGYDLPHFWYGAEPYPVEFPVFIGFKSVEYRHNENVEE